MALLQVKNLNAGYRKRQVLFNISFEIKESEIMLLIGSNGSGKSTLLKRIYGLTDSSYQNGTIIFNTEDISNLKTPEFLSKGIVYIPQKENCFEDLTVEENIEISGLSLKNSNLFKKRREKVLENLPILINLLKQKPSKLSGGERQILLLAMTMFHNPRLILYDEPFAGLSPQNIELVRTHIKYLQKEFNIAFLIVEHRLREAWSLAENVIGFKLGEIKFRQSSSLSFDENVINQLMI